MPGQPPPQMGGGFVWSIISCSIISCLNPANYSGYLENYCYILGILSNAEESMELGSQESRFGFYYYYILVIVPNLDESLELGSHGYRFVNYYNYILGSLKTDESSRLSSHGARQSWNWVRVLPILPSREFT